MLWDFTTNQGSSRLRQGRNWWRVRKQVALLDLVVAEWLREGISEVTYAHFDEQA